MADKINVQSSALNAMRKSKDPVTVFLMNGFQMKGRIKAFDDYCVILTCDGKDSVIYKHAISTFSPGTSLNLQESEK